jgi:hypothetical protein
MLYNGSTSKFTRTALAAMGLSALVLSSASANEVTFFETVFNTDYVSSGFGGMRDNGMGSLTVSGVTGTVSKAYLYWHGPTNTADTTANSMVTFAGSGVTGTNIGLASDNCWGFDNSQAYRADVTSLVTGDGMYSLADFVKAGGDVNVNGASLLVFYDDGDTMNNRDIVLFDGNDSNIASAFDPAGWDVTLDGINYSSGSASMELHVSDGQIFGDDAVDVNGMEVLAAGDVFQGDTVPFDVNGPADNGSLWDIRDIDVTSFLSPGPNSLSLTSGTASDCLGLIVVAINLPAGAAPPGDVPEPGTVALLVGMAVPGVSMFLRRRRNR